MNLGRSILDLGAASENLEDLFRYLPDNKQGIIIKIIFFHMILWECDEIIPPPKNPSRE